MNNHPSFRKKQALNHNHAQQQSNFMSKKSSQIQLVKPSTPKTEISIQTKSDRINQHLIGLK
jgi:hypothetical protein